MKFPLIFIFVTTLKLLEASDEVSRFKSTNGHTCHSTCEKGKDDVFWCRSESGSGMHCSPEASKTYKGESCYDECRSYLDYYFCYLNSNKSKWDYCGPTEPGNDNDSQESANLIDFEVSSGFNFNDRFKSTNGHTCFSECSLGKEGKFWCRSETATEMHCSPDPRKTYKGNSCHADCEKHLDYYFCYTDNKKSDWDYCGPTEAEPQLPEIRLTNEEIEKGGVLKTDVEKLINTEENTIKALEALKEKILKAHKDYSIAKTVGSSVSSAGAVATIAGIALAPVTAGGSLALTAGGLTATIAGAGTTLTTGIVETVKTKEWADELLQALAPREEELKKIGLKIVNHPTWKDYVGKAGSSATYVVTKGPAAVHLGRMIKYLAITAPQYGLHKWPAYYFAVSRVPGQFLLKTNNFVSKALGRMGIQIGGKVGIAGLKVLSAALGVVGIGLDIYTIVDTWTSDPKLATQIDEILNYLNESTGKLKEFKSEL